MRTLTLALLSGLTTASASTSAIACDPDTGNRIQMVFLDWNGQSVKHWTADPDVVEAVDLPNGFHLGVRIEPATQEKYAERTVASRFFA